MLMSPDLYIASEFDRYKLALCLKRAGMKRISSALAPSPVLVSRQTKPAMAAQQPSRQPRTPASGGAAAEVAPLTWSGVSLSSASRESGNSVDGGAQCHSMLRRGVGHTKRNFGSSGFEISPVPGGCPRILTAVGSEAGIGSPRDNSHVALADDPFVSVDSELGPRGMCTVTAKGSSLEILGFSDAPSAISRAGAARYISCDSDQCCADETIVSVQYHLTVSTAAWTSLHTISFFVFK